MTNWKFDVVEAIGDKSVKALLEDYVIDPSVTPDEVRSFLKAVKALLSEAVRAGDL